MSFSHEEASLIGLVIGAADVDNRSFLLHILRAVAPAFDWDELVGEDLSLDGRLDKLGFQKSSRDGVYMGRTHRNLPGEYL